mgnify:FL=1
MYNKEMLATLLLPAGVTSEASIYYKDEDLLLLNSIDIDKVYVEKVLPNKMIYNLRSIKKFGIYNDLLMIIRTIGILVPKGESRNQDVNI